MRKIAPHIVLAFIIAHDIPYVETEIGSPLEVRFQFFNFIAVVSFKKKGGYSFLSSRTLFSDVSTC
jgi:hypothetical protein